MADARRSPVLRARLRAQGLAGAPLGSGPDGPVAVAERLLAIQAQDPRGARLAIRARTRGTGGADVDRGLTEDRTLVLTWLNRGTLHLVRAEDYPLLQGLTAPTIRTAVDTRLVQNGIDPATAQRAVACVDRALADAGPLSRAALGTHLERVGVPVAGQALVHVLIRASLDGVLVRGPMDGAEHLYARVADWLPGAADAVAAVRARRRSALSTLATRFLAGHGPADDRDLARWAGLPLRDARAGLEAIAPRLREREAGLVELAGGPADDRGVRLPAPRLLGAFEPLLMGWCSRSEVLGDHEPSIVTGGIFRGFALVRGRAAAVWRFAGSGLAVAPLVELDPGTSARLARDGEAVIAFLGR